MMMSLGVNRDFGVVEGETGFFDVFRGAAGIEWLGKRQWSITGNNYNKIMPYNVLLKANTAH